MTDEHKWLQTKEMGLVQNRDFYCSRTTWNDSRLLESMAGYEATMCLGVCMRVFPSVKVPLSVVNSLQGRFYAA
jgi:hypothetical protein